MRRGVLKIGGVPSVAAAVGAQSEVCVRLKQNLQCYAFAWPANAMFQRVGSIFAQGVSRDAAAIWWKCRSYPSQPSLLYSAQAFTHYKGLVIHQILDFCWLFGSTDSNINANTLHPLCNGADLMSF